MATLSQATNAESPASGLAGATPYGAIAGAAASMLTGLAAADATPSNAVSGAGLFQTGPFTVGAKNVGSGKQNADTTARADATQTPSTDGTASADADGFSLNSPVVIVGIVALAALLAVALLTTRPKG